MSPALLPRETKVLVLRYWLTHFGPAKTIGRLSMDETNTKTIKYTLAYIMREKLTSILYIGNF